MQFYKRSDCIIIYLYNKQVVSDIIYEYSKLREILDLIIDDLMWMSQTHCRALAAIDKFKPV